MITAGVDLAAEAARTAVAVLEWDGHSARVNSLRIGAIDAEIVEAVMSADKSGVNCPFGWPRAFVSMVTDHEAGRLLPLSRLGGVGDEVSRCARPTTSFTAARA